MKKNIFQFAAVVALACAPSMCAVKQELTISDGSGNSFSIDQSGNIVATTGSVSIAAGNISVDGVGSITLTSNASGVVMVGSFKINSATAFGLADSISPEIQDQITLDTSSVGSGTLNILYTDTTYTNLGSTLNLAGSESTSNTPATNVTFTAFGSNGVALPATTTLGGIGPLSGFSSSGSANVTNSFTGASASVSSLATVTFSGPGTFNTTFAISNVPASGCVPVPNSSFQVRYAANLNIGESYIDLTNTGANGAPVLGPGFGGASGNICVNVYAFDPGEELISCCSCLITPDQTVNLGVNRDLTVKTLTGMVPNSVTIKVLATLAGPGGSGTSCNNSAGTLNSSSIVPGLAAWGTTLHAAAAAGAFDTTESPFTQSTLSTCEITSLTGRCASIIGNGSGFGVCNSCRAGALGANKSSQ